MSENLNYGWPKGDGDTSSQRLDGKWWRGPVTRPRVVMVHYNFGEAPFCGTRSAKSVTTLREEDITCRRCHHKIGLQESHR